MYHNGIICLVNSFIPDVFKDFVCAEHLAWVLCQQTKNIKFKRCQLDFLTIYSNNVCCAVDYNTSY